MLRHILRSGSPMRLFVLATYRDTDLDRTHPLSDVLADLRRQAGVDRLDLGGLGPAEVASFMEAAAGHDLDEPGVALAQAVFAETQGNPFFVGEVLRHLVESGAIVQRDGRWTSDKTLEEVGIPEGIREVLGRRLSRLSETANRALAIAAVIGATFDLATIEAAGGPTGDELFDALDEAAVALDRPRGARAPSAGTRSRTRSCVPRCTRSSRRTAACACTGGSAKRSRRATSATSTTTSTSSRTSSPRARSPVIRSKAVDYCRRAGEHAEAELAFEAAAQHFERAVATLELVDDADPQLRCDLQIALAIALRQRGRRASPRRDVRRRRQRPRHERRRSARARRAGHCRLPERHERRRRARRPLRGSARGTRRRRRRRCGRG